VPWCDPCGKYWRPNEVTKDGACPTCETVLATKGSLRSEARSLGLPGPGEQEGDPPKAPWHFKVLVGATTLYLVWRAVQGIDWVAHRF
jgi:hypothetical protein